MTYVIPRSLDVDQLAEKNMTTMTSHCLASGPHALGRQDKTPWPLWILDLVFLAFAAVFVYLAPCGTWKNVIWDQTMWDNNDPGGPYVISSLLFFRQFGHPPFIGHPGILLQAMISAAAHVIYAVQYLAGDSQPFLEFWARNIRWLFTVAGLIIAVAHVASFHILYAFAKRLLGDAKPAFLAVLTYATLFPVLFYATRISVEPIWVSMILLTLLYVWRTLEAWQAAQRGRAYWLACLAGIASAAALLTKVHLSFPLIPLCLLQVFLRKGGDGAGLWRRIATRYKLACYYIAAASVVLTVGVLSIDVQEFYRTWRNFSPDGTQQISDVAKPTPSIDLERSVYVVAESTLLSLKAYFTPRTTQYVFTITEAVFCVLAAMGLIAFWYARPDKRALVFWPLAYGLLLLPVIGYRGAWHYLFFHLAVASVFVAFLLYAMAHHLLARRIGPTPVYALLIILVLLIHSVSITFAFASKCADVKAYRSTYKALHDALAKTKRGERVAVLVTRRLATWNIHGSHERWSPSAGQFRQAFDNLFVLVRSRRLPKAFLAANRLGAAVDARQRPWRLISIKRRSTLPAKSTTNVAPASSPVTLIPPATSAADAALSSSCPLALFLPLRSTNPTSK